jgi:HEPN domain-containing protein
MKRQEFLDLAEERLREAKCLLDAGLWSGAYYLSGYAVEFFLKAMIAAQFKANDIPDPKEVRNIWTHDLNALVRLAKLEPDLEGHCKRAPQFDQNWNEVRNWSESARYENIDKERALALHVALSDPNDGVIAWIRSKLQGAGQS